MAIIGVIISVIGAAVCDLIAALRDERFAPQALRRKPRVKIVGQVIGLSPTPPRNLIKMRVVGPISRQCPNRDPDLEKHPSPDGSR
jgi:hypothetical protein